MMCFVPVSIHVMPAFAKECTDRLHWAIIENLRDEALCSWKCAISCGGEACGGVAAD